MSTTCRCVGAVVRQMPPRQSNHHDTSHAPMVLLPTEWPLLHSTLRRRISSASASSCWAVGCCFRMSRT
jgi:hypothetical protein